MGGDTEEEEEECCRKEVEEEKRMAYECGFNPFDDARSRLDVRAGKRRYEVSGVEEKRAKRALEKAGKKRPIRTKRVKRKWSR